MSDEYIEKAQRRLISADQIMRGVKSTQDLLESEEAQIQALIGIGYILLKISDQLEQSEAHRP